MGGAVDFGDTLAATAKREAREELGVEVEILHQLGAIDHFIPKEGQHWVTVTFLARLVAGQVPYIAEPHKCDALEWFRLDSLPSPLATSTGGSLALYEQFCERQR